MHHYFASQFIVGLQRQTFIICLCLLGRRELSLASQLYLTGICSPTCICLQAIALAFQLSFLLEGTTVDFELSLWPGKEKIPEVRLTSSKHSVLIMGVTDLDKNPQISVQYPREPLIAWNQLRTSELGQNPLTDVIFKFGLFMHIWHDDEPG